MSNTTFQIKPEDTIVQVETIPKRTKCNKRPIPEPPWRNRPLTPIRCAKDVGVASNSTQSEMITFNSLGIRQTERIKPPTILHPLPASSNSLGFTNLNSEEELFDDPGKNEKHHLHIVRQQSTDGHEIYLHKNNEGREKRDSN